GPACEPCGRGSGSRKIPKRVLRSRAPRWLTAPSVWFSCQPKFGLVVVGLGLPGVRAPKGSYSWAGSGEPLVTGRAPWVVRVSSALPWLSATIGPWLDPRYRRPPGRSTSGVATPLVILTVGRWSSGRLYPRV